MDVTWNIARATAFALYLLCVPLQAAAPGTHLHTAELWMKHHGPYEDAEKAAFVTGTLFPDIRYLGTISRKETHEKKVTAQKIRLTRNAFLAGKRLHAFVDVKREKFIKKCGILSRLKMVPKKQRVFFLKLLEDEILWDRTDTSFGGRALSSVYPEELKDVDEATVLDWHRQLTDYFQQRPSEFLARKVALGQGFLQADVKTADDWSRLVPLLAVDPVFVEYTEQLLDHLERFYSK